MTFPTNTIRLEAARSIFTGVKFSEIMVNDKRVGFKAVFVSGTFEDASLSMLCQRLWQAKRQTFGLD
jgi:hypothetical protein